MLNSPYALFREVDPLLTSSLPIESGDGENLFHQAAPEILQEFWQQWENHREALYRCCLRLMNSNPTDAEDALSRAMLKAWEKVQKFSGKIDNFKAWLIQLARNLCIDIIRERSRGPAGVEDIERAGTGGEIETASSVETPEQALERSERSLEVRRAIADLPQKLRDTFVLHFYEELTNPEIAERLGISYDSVCKRISRARKKLKEKLSGYFQGEEATGTRVLARKQQPNPSHANAIATPTEGEAGERVGAIASENLQLEFDKGEATPTERAAPESDEAISPREGFTNPAEKLQSEAIAPESSHSLEAPVPENCEAIAPESLPLESEGARATQEEGFANASENAQLKPIEAIAPEPTESLEDAIALSDPAIVTPKISVAIKIEASVPEVPQSFNDRNELSAEGKAIAIATITANIGAIVPEETDRVDGSDEPPDKGKAIATLKKRETIGWFGAIAAGIDLLVRDLDEPPDKGKAIAIPVKFSVPENCERRKAEG